MTRLTNQTGARRTRRGIPLPFAFAPALFVALFVAPPAALPAPAGSGVRDARQAAAKQAQRVARVPFEMNGNSLFLRVSVNGSGPRWFVIDTGAAITVFNSAMVESLGLKTRRLV